MLDPKRNGTPAPAGEEKNPPASDFMQATEAVIFAADAPVSSQRIADVMAEVTGQAAPPGEAVEAAIDALNTAYEKSGRAFRIHRWAGGFRMATERAWAPFVRAFFTGEQTTRLSRSLMETLAVVAYRQPVTRPEIEFVRGVSADYAVRKLLDLGLVDVTGRSDALGRPLLYGTTPRFLEQFGLDGLDDLPTLREIEDLLGEPRFNAERLQLLDLRRAAESEKAARAEEAAAENSTEAENL